MTDIHTLLQAAARCRRMAARCASAAIASKFEALARDYEEHARQVGRSPLISELGGKATNTQQDNETPELIEPSRSAT